MLHAIHIHRQPDLSSLALPPATARLVRSHVEAQTELRHTASVCERYQGELSWIEHAELSALGARVEFINRLCDHVIDAGVARDQPLTLVSLGSGGLLTEALIHDQLQAAGYTDIRWRTIDLSYRDDGGRAARRAFMERVNGKVAAFTTEQAYLNKVVEGERLALADRAAGTTIVLCINPPAWPDMLGALEPDATGEGAIGVRGGIVDDVTKANAVAMYIGVTLKELRPALGRMCLRTMWTNCLVRLYIDRATVMIDTAPGEIGHGLQRMIAPYVEQVVNDTPKDETIGLVHLDRAAAGLARACRALDHPTVRVQVSDYDVACTHLRRHFADGSRMFFACMSHNRTWILDR